MKTYSLGQWLELKQKLSEYCEEFQSKDPYNPPTFLHLSRVFHITYDDLEALAEDEGLCINIGMQIGGGGGYGVYENKSDWSIEKL